MGFKSIFAQRTIGRSWGYTAQVASQAAIFITVLNLFMLAATFYKTTLLVWLTERNLYVAFWEFMVVLIALLMIMAVLLYKFAVPSFFSAFSEQFYKHNNPLKDDIDALKRDNKEIIGRLKKLEGRR